MKNSQISQEACENSGEIIVNDSEFETVLNDGQGSAAEEVGQKDKRREKITFNLKAKEIKKGNEGSVCEVSSLKKTKHTSSLLRDVPSSSGTNTLSHNEMQTTLMTKSDLKSESVSSGSFHDGNFPLEFLYKKFLTAAKKGNRSLLIKTLDEISSKKKDFGVGVNNNRESPTLSESANLNYQNEDGNTALHLSCEEGNYKIIELLIKNKCDLNKGNKANKTPLHISVIKGYYDITKMLINAGADVNKIDIEKNTPLHYACMNDNTEIIKLILDNNSSSLPNNKNIFGKTPQDLCSLEKNKCLFKNYNSPEDETINDKAMPDPKLTGNHLAKEAHPLSKRSSKEFNNLKSKPKHDSNKILLTNKKLSVTKSYFAVANNKISKTAVKRKGVIKNNNELLKTKFKDNSINKFNLESILNTSYNFNMKHLQKPKESNIIKYVNKANKSSKALGKVVSTSKKEQEKLQISSKFLIKNKRGINFVKTSNRLNTSSNCCNSNNNSCLNNELENSLNLSSAKSQILAKIKMSPETNKTKATKKKITVQNNNGKNGDKTVYVYKNSRNEITDNNNTLTGGLYQRCSSQKSLAKSSEFKTSPPKIDSGNLNCSVKPSKKAAAKNYMENDLTLNSIKEEAKISTSSFVCLARLGKGSFGEVFLVEKIDTRERFAMKVLRKEKVLRQNLIKYVVTERNILSISNHPFIVKLFYSFQTSTKLFLILEYCLCGDLSVHLFFEKKFHEYRAKHYICQILLALEYLHKNDIIFRDLKPENVVLDEEGNAKLTDFGLSKEGVSGFAGAKSFCGSLAYLAPEMLKKEGHGKAVDWYLLGVLFYELLVGVTPFFAYNAQNLFYNIENCELRIPSFVSEDARNLLRGLLEKNPRKRLGGGYGDSEEIKAHPYFKETNWDDVYNKAIEAPQFRNYNKKTVRYFKSPKLFVNEDNVEKNNENLDSNINVKKEIKIDENSLYMNNDKISDMNLTYICFKKKNLLPGWSFAIKD